MICPPYVQSRYLYLNKSGRRRAGCPVVIIVATGFEVRGFKPGRGQWIFSELKNPEHDFLQKGSKAMGPVS